MAKIIAYVGMLTLVVTLGSTILAIWARNPAAAQFLELTKALLSWKVIIGSLATGGTFAFKTEIKKLFERAAQSPVVYRDRVE